MYWFTENNLDWVTISPRFGTNNGSINITVDRNPNFSVRSGSITVLVVL